MNRFFLPVLQFTIQNNGEATNTQIWDSILSVTIQPKDLEIQSGETRWMKNLRDAKRSLVRKGYLQNTRSKYVVTPEGISFYNSLV